jgi:cyclopropane fatty-acyl-phospholipid synthase-like methyltransferase
MEKAARIIGKLTAGKECTLLDIGCGGATLMRLLPPNVEYYGIDIAIPNPAPNLLEADILQAPISFAGKSFDIITAQGIFEYLGDHQQEKFAEIAGLLNPGGKFLVTYWNFSHRKLYVHEYFSHVQSVESFREGLEQYFEIDQFFPASHNWRHGSPHKPLGKVINKPMSFRIPFISSRLAVEYFFICSPRSSEREPA